MTYSLMVSGPAPFWWAINKMASVNLYSHLTFDIVKEFTIFIQRAIQMNPNQHPLAEILHTFLRHNCGLMHSAALCKKHPLIILTSEIIRSIRCTLQTLPRLIDRTVYRNKLNLKMCCVPFEKTRNSK